MPTADLLYTRVADQIAESISGGTFGPDHRLPSIRQLQRQMSISRSTAIAAYRALERRGVIGVRPQSGFYVRVASHKSAPQVGATRPSSVPRKVVIASPVVQMIHVSGDTSILPLGAAEPPSHCLPTKRLNRLSAAIARASVSGANYYDKLPGDEGYRTQVARLMLDNGCVALPEDVVATSGCADAVTLALRAVARPGDLIAIESPAYYGHLLLLNQLNLKAVEIATDPNTGMDLDALASALRRRKIAAVLVNPNHQNPLGYAMTDAAKKKLVDLCEQSDVPLVEDDIYGDLAHAGARPRSCKAVDKTGNVLYCNSFSKTIAPGLRVGFCLPGKWLNGVLEAKFATSVATPTLAQRTIAAYLASGEYTRHVRRISRIYAEQIARYASAVVRHFPKDTRLSRPVGGFVLWLESPTLKDAMHLQQLAIAQKIAVAPGPIFSPAGKFKNCLRLTCGPAWSSDIDSAIQKLGKLSTQV